MRPAGFKDPQKPAESFCCCASRSSSGFDSAAFMIPPHYSSLLYNFLSILRSLRHRSACTHNLGRFLCCRILLLTFFPLLRRSSIGRTLKMRKICSAHCCGHLNLLFIVIYAQKSDFTTLLRRHAIGAGVSSEKTCYFLKSPKVERAQKKRRRHGERKEWWK